MINSITIKGPASYKEKAVLETQQNVNLIYGLNGAGKSTFSEFLRNYKDERYKECSIEPKINDEEEEILVYNEHYVDEVFYESTKQKGIFSLSKENNAAKKIIDTAKEKRQKISENILKEQQSFSIIQQEWGKQYNGYVERVWGVQREFSGGDRVLDYCLIGYKRSKEVLFGYLSSLPKPLVKPDYTIDMLKNQVRLLEAATSTPIENLSEVISLVTELENDSIFQDVITGNKDSYVAALINELQNSDCAMATIKNFERGSGFKLNGFKEIVPSNKLKPSHEVDLFDTLVAHTDLTQKAEVIGNAEMLLSKAGYNKIIMSMDLVKVLPKRGVSKFLLGALLKNPVFKAHCLRYVNGTTVLHLSKTALDTYTLFFPDDCFVLKRFDEICESICRELATLIEESRALAEMRDALLPKLMSGEIDVSEVAV